MAGKLKWWYRVAAAALALWNAPAAAGYFEWSAAVDSGQVEWCGQTERQVAEVLEIDADEVRQAIDALMSGAPEDVRVLSVWGNEVYAQARKTWGGPVLFHSDDGGRSWRVVWTRDGYGDDYAANRVNAVLPDPVTGERWIGTSFGLFLGDEETDLPPSAVEVIALGADPARPGALWVATDNTNLTYQGQVSGAGFFRRRVSGGEVSWEDVSVGLGSRVEAVGFDAAEPERVYVRRKGSGQVIAALAPDVMTPELVGWTTVDAMPSPYRLGSVVLGEALRVPGSYPRHLVVSDIIDYLAKGQLGYPLALGGLLYTKSYWIHGGLRQTSLFRSRDGGVSWTGMGGHAHYDGRQTGAGELILWDNREQVLFSGNGLPHVAAQRVTTWCHHPLDAGTVYVVQRGRGHLYRSDDLSTWTELSAGLDPMLWPVSVAVDSLSRVYLATTDGTYRYDEAPRPYSLESVTLEPDTVRLGREGSVAVTVRVTSRAGDAAAPHVAVRLMGTAYEAADRTASCPCTAMAPGRTGRRSW